MLCFVGTLNLSAQQNPTFSYSENDYVLYSTLTGKKASIQEIIMDAANAEVILFGEEHNDSIGHQLQYKMLSALYNKYGNNVALSMEMFDRDVQHIMDEYLSGLIKQSYFYKDSRKWSNYKDYEPMVEFCKENQLNVICANAPFRYVNVASQKGLDGLQKLSVLGKKAIAPLPYNLANGDYAAKLNALMGHDPNDPNSKPAYDMIPGQSLWDATMAYSMHQYRQEHENSKILMLNGRFHSDQRFGIVQRLAEYDSTATTLVISMVGDLESFPKVKIKNYKELGDYVIFTNPAVPRSY